MENSNQRMEPNKKPALAKKNTLSEYIDLIPEKRPEEAVTPQGHLDHPGSTTPEKGKKKKEDQPVEVLPNRSWVTNFYHNYIKAIERADLDPRQLQKQMNKDSAESSIKIRPKEVVSPFKSILLVPPVKHEREKLLTAVADFPVIRAFKEILEEKKFTTSITQQQGIQPSAHRLYTNLSEPISNRGKFAFTLQDVPVKEFEKLGISQEYLLKDGMLDKLLKGEKTKPVENLSITSNDGKIKYYAASFHLDKNPDGSVGLKLHYLPAQLKNEISPGINFKIPQTVKGVNLSMQEQKDLKEGKEIRLLGLKSISGTYYDATLRVDLIENKLKFSNPTPSHVKTNKQVENNVANEKDVVAKRQGNYVDLPSRQTGESKEKQAQKSKGMRL
ncbi:DUF3945 domain-containing protein [Rhodocytophaga rosea]|uniref:DUF3945 domain-containing protein n=1 Tax=Rhodocytophaga rosea TaxID=2704465 RepID=A0A6C0GRQ8_9BACT|nr:DUF4099 domain-containing protein [Rhodocytophaga rosea]QHT70758.1 DUF3945 domain-containing protein [Rhodocytophaga rosea]